MKNTIKTVILFYLKYDIINEGGDFMSLMELLKLLVTTESQDERMSLVETNKDLIDEGDASSSDANTERIAELELQLKEQKQKYIDTFFGGTKEAETETETNNDEESKSLDDLGM